MPNPFTTHLLLGFCLASAPALVRAAQPPVITSEPADDAAYSAGVRAIHEQRWQDAIRAFDQVIAIRETHRADAALYWKAYALNKLARPADTHSTCVQLHAQFPASTWNRDCQTLQLVHSSADSAQGESSSEEVADGSSDDLKILALNSLVHQDPARAMPILRGILSGRQSEDMKQQALFVLTQNHSPEANALLQDAATGKLGRSVQLHAINAIGVFKGHQQGEFLESLYQSTPDPEVKQAVISALFVARDATRMVAMARAEKNVELKRQIVSQLAIMNDKAATDYMLELLK